MLLKEAKGEQKSTANDICSEYEQNLLFYLRFFLEKRFSFVNLYPLWRHKGVHAILIQMRELARLSSDCNALETTWLK